MEGWMNTNLVRVNEENMLYGSRFVSLFKNKSKKVDTAGNDSFTGKKKSINGVSENLVGAVSTGENNGNHDAIIRGNNKEVVNIGKNNETNEEINGGVNVESMKDYVNN